MPFKEYWYDWGGFNDQIFEQLYIAQASPQIVNVVHTLHMVAGFSTASYWLAYFAGCVVLGILINIVRQGNILTQIGRGVVLIAAITASLFLAGKTIEFMKVYFAFPRPYVALTNVVGMFALPGNAGMQSFPSGHAAFAACLITAIWVRLSGWSKIFGIGFVAAVGWSRVAGGFHFPADVVAGALIAIAVTIIAESIVFGIYHKLTPRSAAHAERKRLH